MSDRNNIKKQLKENFDMQKNYNQIINKLERKEKSLLKYSLVPICLLLAIGFMIFHNRGNGINKYTTNNGNEIVINKLKDVSLAKLDADVRLDIDVRIQEKFDEYPFINSIKVPNDLQLSSRYLLYTKKLYETKEKYRDAPYDVLHDYVVLYESTPDSNGLIEKQIMISFSKDFEPLRDYYINHKPLKNSKINNIEIKIANYNVMYIATFRYMGLNFDIETTGITENEVIALLESIVK